MKVLFFFPFFFSFFFPFDFSLQVIAIFKKFFFSPPLSPANSLPICRTGNHVSLCQCKTHYIQQNPRHPPVSSKPSVPTFLQLFVKCVAHILLTCISWWSGEIQISLKSVFINSLAARQLWLAIKIPRQWSTKKSFSTNICLTPHIAMASCHLLQRDALDIGCQHVIARLLTRLRAGNIRKLNRSCHDPPHPIISLPHLLALKYNRKIELVKVRHRSH